MSLVFESLGALSTHLEQRGVRVVDPGVPLTQVVAARDDLWRQPSVRKVVGFIARNVASIPLHVYERASDTDRPRVVDGPLAEVVSQPAPLTTPFRFWERVLIDWLLHDRWCVAKEPTDDGGMRLVRLPIRTWRFRTDGLDRVVAVQLLIDGRWVDRDPDGFVFDHGYARVGAAGVSPAETLRDLLDEADEAVAWRRQLWRSGARVPAVIERPPNTPWSDEARSRFKRSWEAFKQGGGREGETPILEDGMELKEVRAFSPRDAQDIEGRRLTDIEVCTAYHLAPEMLGIRQGTYSNVEAFRQSLYRDSLGPLITQWEQVLNVMLVPDLAGSRRLYVEAHLDAKLRGSFEEQAQVLSTSVGAPWMLRNEARARLNLPALDEGDDLVTPLNVLVGGLASPRDTAPDPKTSPVRGTKALEDGLGTVAAERAALEDDLASYQSQLADHLAAALGVKATPDLDAAFDLQAWNEVLRRVLTGRSRRVAQAAALEVLEQFNPGREGWSEDVMDGWLAKAAESNSARANQALYDRLAAALASGDGWQDAVRSVLTAAEFAEVWGATLGTEAASFGRHDAASASGLATKTWSTTSSNPRGSHSALSGVTVGIDDVFSNGARWPGDWQAGAGEVVNCRCVVSYGRSD